jgi:hypothetical protein
MRHHGITQALFALAYYVLLVWMAQMGNLLLGGVWRVIAWPLSLCCSSSWLDAPQIS